MPRTDLSHAGFAGYTMTMKRPDADTLIELLDLAPLQGEGGYFRRTCEGKFDENGRASYSAIYYLLCAGDGFSEMHRLPHDELYHFYLGDSVEMLVLEPKTKISAAREKRVVLGQNVLAGELVQFLVPAGCWHGSKLIDNGHFALLGTSMTPGYMDLDYERAECAKLLADFPDHHPLIRQLTREKT